MDIRLVSVQSLKTRLATDFTADVAIMHPDRMFGLLAIHEESFFLAVLTVSSLCVANQDLGWSDLAEQYVHCCPFSVAIICGETTRD